jgi:hypothetical protein
MTDGLSNCLSDGLTDAVTVDSGVSTAGNKRAPAVIEVVESER